MAQFVFGSQCTLFAFWSNKYCHILWYRCMRLFTLKSCFMCGVLSTCVQSHHTQLHHLKRLWLTFNPHFYRNELLPIAMSFAILSLQPSICISSFLLSAVCISRDAKRYVQHIPCIYFLYAMHFALFCPFCPC